MRELRLPRALAAFAVGGLLALAGALMQVLLRNPLADPYILGISGGAAVGALGAMLAGAAALVTPAALAGALASTLLVFGLARTGADRAPWTTTRLLLTGVVVAAGWGALIALMLTLAPDAQVKGMLFWLIGDLGGATAATPALVALAVALLGALAFARDLNVLARGEDVAAALGVAVRAHHARALRRSPRSPPPPPSRPPAASASSASSCRMRCACASATTSACCCRRAALAGGTLLVLADTLARTRRRAGAAAGRRDHRARRRAGVPRLLGRGARAMTADAPRLSCRGLALSVAGRTLVAGSRPRRARRRVLGRHRAERRRQDDAGRDAGGPARAGRRRRSRTTARRSRHSAPRERARRRGFLPQDSVDSFPGDACSRPRSSAAIRISRAGNGNRPPTSIARARALAAFGLAGLDARDARTLSGGERRRLALAALVAQDPGAAAAGRAVVASRPRRSRSPRSTRWRRWRATAARRS